MNELYTIVLDNCVKIPGLFGKRSLTKQRQIQERWDARCQKRRLQSALTHGNEPPVRKI